MADRLLVRRQRFFRAARSHQAVAADRKEDRALLGGSHAFEKAMVLFFLFRHRVGPLPVVRVVVGGYSNRGRLNVEACILIIPTHEKVVLRAD